MLSFWFPPGFYEKISLRIFLHNSFHVGVMQITLNLILYKILDTQPHIKFINRGLSIVQKLNVKCDSS